MCPETLFEIIIVLIPVPSMFKVVLDNPKSHHLGGFLAIVRPIFIFLGQNSKIGLLDDLCISSKISLKLILNGCLKNWKVG